MWPRGTAREAAWFAAVAMIGIDIAAVVLFADYRPIDMIDLRVWSLVKALITAGGLGWIARRTGERIVWALVVVVLVVAVEDYMGASLGIGKGLLEIAGVHRPGALAPLVQRSVLLAAVGVPLAWLVPQTPEWLRRLVAVYIGLLGLLLVASIGLDAIADLEATNMDELVEEPLLSLLAAVTVGFVTELVLRPRHLRRSRKPGRAARSARR